MHKTIKPAHTPLPPSFGFSSFALRTVFAVLFALCLVVRAEDIDDQYVHALTTMQQGDLMKAAGNNDGALAKYREAQHALQVFKKDHPEWNPKIVAYRASVIADKISAITGETPGAPGMPSSETRASQAASKTAAASSGQTVKLLSAGAEPRKVLRLHPKAGDKQSIQMTITAEIANQVGEAQIPPMKVPPITMTIETTVKDVTSEGDINYETVISDASAAEAPGTLPQIVEATKAQVAALKGKTGSGAISSQGITRKSEMKATSGADAADQMSQYLSDLSSVMLPEEAVGVGAKWEVRKPIKSKGLTISETTSYQLVSAEGDRLTAKATIAQSAPKQKIDAPGMAGVKVDLNKMTGTGSADFNFDLTQLLPSAGNMKSHSEMSMSGGMGGQKQNMIMKVDTTITLEAK
jgi:hypothetical protein